MPYRRRCPKTEVPERPVFVRGEAAGYEPWEFRFRFRLEGLKELRAPIRL